MERMQNRENIEEKVQRGETESREESVERKRKRRMNWRISDTRVIC